MPARVGSAGVSWIASPAAVALPLSVKPVRAGVASSPSPVNTTSRKPDASSLLIVQHVAVEADAVRACSAPSR